MKDNVKFKINLKILIMVICIISFFTIGITCVTNKFIIDKEVCETPVLIRYDKKGEIREIIEVTSEEDLNFLNIWIDLLKDDWIDEDLKNINIKKDIVIKYNNFIEIYIQLDQEEYCYYINKEKNISSVFEMYEDQYAWIENKIGGFKKEGNISGINYKIYDDYNQGTYDYTKRGYYIDMLNQPMSPTWYVITSGERPEQSYTQIKDIKIDKEKNVEIIVKEYIGHPSYPDVIGYPIPKIYPACCIEFPYESAQNIKSITIKNTEGEVFQNNSNIENEEWKKINLKNCKYYEDCNLKIDLDGDTQEENVEIKSSGKYIIINGKEYIVNKRANDENEDNKDDNLIHVLDNHCNVNQYYIIDMNNDNIMEIIHRTYSNMISPITSYYTIYNLYNYELVQIGEMSFMGNIPNNVYVKDNTIKFKYWPYESPDDYREEIVLDLQLNYLD